MGTVFSKRQSVEFALIPSEEVSGPLGLGDPESNEITKVEEESLIPALMHDRLRTKQCAELWDGKYCSLRNILCFQDGQTVQKHTTGQRYTSARRTFIRH
ncbi:unnamed protein product [Schistosoma rodhaini]|uniref:COX assembly mitochondrial protein n=1 Tax=Schistosoma rodhaini TaxID=6188 RepID=A0AA85EUB7_9TREM|nr:unnamed protein product [Schistosoma rodhaini]CAH8492027.1 unnamed protein product [Schistosoma rodhaini]